MDTPRPTFGLLAQRYRIIRQLGDGGFGQTFLATDEQFPGQPQCVVKQLRPYRATPQTLQLARRLFFSEAEVLSQLGEHPQIPHLLAYFEENDEFYLVQEYIEGADIETELTPGKTWSEVKVIRLLREVLTILQFVHGQNVIHRDLKPANIRRRTNGELVLIDFGAVKQIGEPGMKPDKTKVTVAIGTPGYAPSEQTQGKPRLNSDLYALGMIAIQALTGIEPEHLPEDPHTGEVIWHDRIGQKNLNPLLRQVLDRMVRYDFRQRYPDAAAVLADLADLGSRRATVLRPIQQLNRKRVHPVVAIAIITTLIIAIFVGVVQHLVRQMALDAASLQPATISPAVSPLTEGEESLPPLTGQATALNVTVTAAAYNANLNRLVMVAANPNQLYVYSLLSQRLQNIPLGDVPRQVVLDPAGQRAAVVHDQRITVVNLQRNQVERVIDRPMAIASLVITANGWLYHSSDHDRLFAINIATGETVAEQEGGAMASHLLTRSSLTLHPNGRTLLALTPGGTLIHVFSINGAEIVPIATWTAPSEEGLTLGDRLWISPDGQQAITNQGDRFPLPRLQGSQTLQTQRLPLANTTAPEYDRFAFAPGQILALDGVPLQKLSHIAPQTLSHSQTWQIPPQGETPHVGRHLFFNPRSQEYYLLTQPQGGGPGVLWRGTLEQ
ncbi:MAG: serine/threonine protein kinase [Spirulina sp. DLM2.Bin59]|nr:MAG: serine/threonine protein kinase [Spirulina sp. DLM2.Bin59]